MSVTLLSCSKNNNENVPAIDGEDSPSTEVEVNPQYVPIDWDNHEIVSFDKEQGTLVLNTENSIGSLQKKSVIIVEQDDEHFLRRVNSLINENGKCVVQTQPAYLNDIFVGGGFTLFSLHEMWLPPMAFRLLI